MARKVNILYRVEALPDNDCKQTRLHSNESTHNTRGTVGTGVSYGGPCQGVTSGTKLKLNSYPCGDGVEFLHRDPASRRRRRKGKSQI
jgi:hypothetical protein